MFDVYREMGCGFPEAVCQECLGREFRLRDSPFEARREIVLSYKGCRLNQTCKTDFIRCGTIIVGLKAVKEVAAEHKAQLLDYLKAGGLEPGLPVNFGSYPKAEVIRLDCTNTPSARRS